MERLLVLSPLCGMETLAINGPASLAFGVLSPLCGMETAQEETLTHGKAISSKPTVWDGDFFANVRHFNFKLF